MECRRIVTRDGIYKGIDLWNRVNPSFFIISCLVEQNIFTPFAGVNVRAWGAFEGDNLLAFPGRWHYEAENIRRIPGGIEDYWLLWCDNVPVGFARTNTSEMKPKIDFIIDEKLYPAILCEAI